MPAVDDGQFVKLYNSRTDSVDVNEVLIGTPKTDSASERLASFVEDINGSPVVKSYVDGEGVYVGNVTGAITATTISASSTSALTGAVTLPSLVGTAGSGTGITAAVSGEVRHVVHKVTATYAAFQTAGLTNDKTLWTLPAKTRVLRVVADVTTEFIGGAISACTLRCGKAANGAEYLVDGDVFAAAITLGEVVAERGASLVDATSNDITWSGTQIVNVRLTSVTANLDALTQGSMTLYIECAVYP